MSRSRCVNVSIGLDWAGWMDKGREVTNGVDGPEWHHWTCNWEYYVLFPSHVEITCLSRWAPLSLQKDATVVFATRLVMFALLPPSLYTSTQTTDR